MLYICSGIVSPYYVLLLDIIQSSSRNIQKKKVYGLFSPLLFQLRISSSCANSPIKGDVLRILVRGYRFGGPDGPTGFSTFNWKSDLIVYY